MKLYFNVDLKNKNKNISLLEDSWEILLSELRSFSMFGHVAVVISPERP